MNEPHNEILARCPHTGNPYHYRKAALLGDGWEPIDDDECEAALAQKHRRISLITADVVEAAAHATMDYVAVDRHAFRRRMTCLSKAMWAHSVAERIRKGKGVDDAQLNASWQSLSGPDKASARTGPHDLVSAPALTPTQAGNPASTAAAPPFDHGDTPIVGPADETQMATDPRAPTKSSPPDITEIFDLIAPNLGTGSVKASEIADGKDQFSPVTPGPQSTPLHMSPKPENHRVALVKPSADPGPERPSTEVTASCTHPKGPP
ncbi:MAG: hypothetical protein AAFO78_10210 [Pseudomonadota bacterium]